MTVQTAPIGNTCALGLTHGYLKGSVLARSFWSAESERSTHL